MRKSGHSRQLNCCSFDMTQASGNSAKAAPVPRPPPVAAYSLSERQEEQLRIYLDYMLEVNKSMNLTGVHLCAVEKLVGGLRSFPAAGQQGVLPSLNTKHGTWIVPLLLTFHPAGVSLLRFIPRAKFGQRLCIILCQ